MKIIDIDINYAADCFAALPEGGDWIGIGHEAFGDYLAAAGIADGFDGERLIWYGEYEIRVDPITGGIVGKQGRDRTQPISEYIRQEMSDEDVAGYLVCAAIVTQDDLVQ